MLTRRDPPRSRCVLEHARTRSISPAVSGSRASLAGRAISATCRDGRSKQETGTE